MYICNILNVTHIHSHMQPDKHIHIHMQHSECWCRESQHQSAAPNRRLMIQKRLHKRSQLWCPGLAGHIFPTVPPATRA